MYNKTVTLLITLFIPLFISLGLTLEEVKKSYLSSEGVIVDEFDTPLHTLRINPHQRKLNWTNINEISPSLIHFVKMIEDHRFDSHLGVDTLALLRSLWGNISFSNRTMEGFSTITMQTASLLNPSLRPQKSQSKRSLWQKIKQIFYAYQLEWNLSKEEILTIYLNFISFRGELVGIRAAGEALFAKSPQGIDQLDSLILASLIKNPNATKERLIRRVSYWGRRLAPQYHDQDILDRIEEIFKHPYRLRPIQTLNPTFARSLLQKGPYIKTTLNGPLQHLAQELLNEQINKLSKQNVNEGAILVVENKTGKIKAYIAGPTTTHFTHVDGVVALRQAGSTLKPFLYALAIDKRYITAGSLVDDHPLNIPIEFRGLYRPQNFDNLFHGLISVRKALASSLNIPAVKVLNLIGSDELVQFLLKVPFRGLKSSHFYGPSLALGSVDVALWDLVNAYRLLAQGGTATSMTLFFNENKKEEKQENALLSPDVSYIISSILSDPRARAYTFGLENPLATPYWTAVKTGTSKNMRDNWCVGYSDQYTVGVWVGNFTGEAMWNVTGVTGAAPLWRSIMDYLHKENLSRQPQRPKNVVFYHGEYFLKGTEQVSSLPIQNNKVFPKIVYPPQGTLFAWDPDIPKSYQKITFQASITHPLFILNGRPLPDNEWSIKRGKYLLQLKDKNKSSATVLDEITFDVK